MSFTECARLLGILVSTLAFGLPPCAWAEELDPSIEATRSCECPRPPGEALGLLPIPEYGGRLWRRPKITGDWCARRRCLAKRGVFVDFRWLQVAQGVVDGGFRERWAHTTNLDFYGKLDLMRMRLVPGALVSIRAQSRFGGTVNGDSGLILPVHTAGAFPLTSDPNEDVEVALTELNWLQMFNETFGVLVGKLTTMNVANEFAGGEGYSQFMNFQFIFPAVFAQLAPYSTLGAGVVWAPTPRVTVSSLILNTTDASTSSGLDDFDDGLTWWTSATITHRLRCLPGGVTLGVGYAFDGEFQRIGGLNIGPGEPISLDTESDSWGAFASGWQYLFTLEPPRDIDPTDGQQELRGLGAFAILGVGDEDTNPVNWSIAGGLGGRGLIGGRCDDSFGVGYFYNRLGDPVSGSLLAPRLQHGSQGLEIWYRVALANSVGLTLDAQWAESAFHGAADAFLLAARLGVDF